MNTHVITLWKGGAVFLTEEQNEKMRDFGKDDKAIINGRQVYGANIADIVPIDKYYEENPKELPTPVYKELKAEEMKPLTRNRYINASESMLRGLQKYIRESDNPSEWSLKAEKKLKIRIENAKNGIGGFAKSQIELINL